MFIIFYMFDLIYINLFILFWFGFLFWSYNNKNSILDSHPNPIKWHVFQSHLVVRSQWRSHLFFRKGFSFMLASTFTTQYYAYGAPTISFTNEFFFFLTKLYFWHCSWLILFLSFYISKFLFCPQIYIWMIKKIES